MAPQTRTQRQAAAKKAAATRKRKSARQSSGTAKAAARRSASSAQSTGRSAATASRQRARTAAVRFSAEKAYLEAIARRGERAVLIPVGAALEARDRIAALLRTYGDRTALRSRLKRFERRGANALRRNRRAVERQAREVRNGVEHRANGFQSQASQVVDRVRSLA
jgi:hypothetical protein